MPAYNKKQPVARYAYYCAQCHRVIEPGEQYTRLFGCAEQGDKPYELKLCNKCEPIPQKEYN
jgi:hypothetical protein